MQPGEPVITIDFETKSYADITKVGSWVYSQDPTTEIICMCWAVDDGGIDVWYPNCYEYADVLPSSLFDAIREGDLFEAHNYAFELGIWENIMVKRYGWTEIPRNKWRDTMAAAAYYSMPQHLDGLLKAVGHKGKDPEGSRLITKYSKLFLKTAKTTIPVEDFTKFVNYCKDDVSIERQISNYLGDLPERELEVFLMDMEINLRGLYLDKEGLEAATYIVDTKGAELVEEFQEITGLKPSQREKVQDWFGEQGIELEDMKAENLREKLKAIRPFTPENVVRALELRLAISKATTKKLGKMIGQRSEDGTAKFQCRYHGAGTGRWTGSGFQPLNLSRGYEGVSPNQLCRDIKHRNPEYLDSLYGNCIEAVGKASRHWIQARCGHRLLVGDFASIEAVVLAALAEEDWKVQAFREGAKIYEMTADKIYKLPSGTVNKKDHPEKRSDGKICELAFGYQGALGAWRNFDKSDMHSDEAVIHMCNTWRVEHPAIVQFWDNLNDAAITAMTPGCDGAFVKRSNISFARVDEWLSMILPNGKRIWYFDPELRPKLPQWHQPKEKEKCRDGTCSCEARTTLTYMAQKEGVWKRVGTYGGKLAENATQATSREILVSSMFRAREAGYPLILSVYDEIVCEVPDGFGSVEEFETIMKDSDPSEPWYDWPIGVEAWEGNRYKK